MSPPVLTESLNTTKQQVARSETHAVSTRSFQGGINPILQLQRTLGNHRVGQLIKAGRLTSDGKIIGLQPKLIVGAANDQYEQEADHVARQVVSMPDSVARATLQQKAPTGDDGSKAAPSTLQTKPLPLAASIAPLVNRQSQTAEIEEDKDKEDGSELLQARLFNKSFEPPLQRLTSTDEEETEPLQAKPAESLHRSFEAGDEVESRLSQSKGGGSPLPDPVRTYMEPRFGVDFGHVRVHTGSDSLQMNQAIGAQAFTHGADVYYGAGTSPTNLELTAHELTHVVQQTGGHQDRHTSVTQPKSTATPMLAVQRDGPSVLPPIPNLQLTAPSLLQPEPPGLNLTPQYTLRLDPALQQPAYELVSAHLAADRLRVALKSVRLGIFADAGDGATAPPAAFAVIPPIGLQPSPPINDPLDPAAAPKSASSSDLMDALLATPEVEQLLNTIKANVAGEWGKLSKGEKGAIITTVVSVGLGSLGGAIASPSSRQSVMAALSGKILPVPGVNWLRIEINPYNNGFMFGAHVDVGCLLPPAWGFGPSPSSPSPITQPAVQRAYTAPSILQREPLGPQVPSSIDPSKTSAGFSIDLPPKRMFKRSFKVNVTTGDDIGTRMGFNISQAGISITLAPPIIIDAVFPVANMDWMGLTYSFSSGSVTAVSLTKSSTGFSPEDEARTTIIGLFMPLLKGTRAADKGYDPLTDPDLAGTGNAIKANFLAQPSDEKADKIPESEITNLTLEGKTTLKSAIEGGSDEGRITIPGGTPLSIRVRMSGSLESIKTEIEPSLEIITITAEDLSKPIIVSKMGKEVAGLIEINLRRGGSVDIGRFVLRGEAKEMADVETVGLMALLNILVRVGGAGITPQLNTSTIDTSAKVLPGLARGLLEAALTKAVRKLIEDYRTAIPGVDIGNIIGLPSRGDFPAPTSGRGATRAT